MQAYSKPCVCTPASSVSLCFFILKMGALYPSNALYYGSYEQLLNRHLLEGSFSTHTREETPILGPDLILVSLFLQIFYSTQVPADSPW